MFNNKRIKELEEYINFQDAEISSVRQLVGRMEKRLEVLEKAISPEFVKETQKLSNKLFNGYFDINDKKLKDYEKINTNTKSKKTAQ